MQILALQDRRTMASSWEWTRFSRVLSIITDTTKSWATSVIWTGWAIAEGVYNWVSSWASWTVSQALYAGSYVYETWEDAVLLARNTALWALEQGVKIVPTALWVQTEALKMVGVFSDIYKWIQDKKFNTPDELIDFILNEVYTDSMNSIVDKRIISDMLINPSNIPFIIVREMVFYILNEFVVSKNA